MCLLLGREVLELLQGFRPFGLHSSDGGLLYKLALGHYVLGSVVSLLCSL